MLPIRRIEIKYSYKKEYFTKKIYKTASPLRKECYKSEYAIMSITGDFIAQNVLRVNMNSSVLSDKWNELQNFIFIINKDILIVGNDLLKLEINHNVYPINNTS